MANAKVEILSQTSNDVQFLLTGTSLPIANALRRAALSEVASMAIDEIEITENTSVNVFFFCCNNKNARIEFIF